MTSQIKRLTLPDDRILWPARCAGETRRQYEAFVSYREMSPSVRNARTAAIVHYRLPVDATEREVANKWHQMRAWSAANRWRERVDEWDRQQAEAVQAAEAEELAAMRQAHADAGRTIAQMGLERLKAIDPLTISPHTARLLVQTGVAIERAARGDSPGAVKVEGTVEVAGLSDQLRDMFAAAEEVGRGAVWGADESDS